MRKKPSVLQILFSLIILFIICMSPVYLINVYRSANILANKDKFVLKKYKIDSISTTTSSDINNNISTTTGYLVFFNDKKEKLKISIIDKNRFSFSKRTNYVYKDFEKYILKENGWLGRSAADSINIWRGPNSNLYGLKKETELDVSSYQNKLVFNILLIIITILSVRYFVKYRKKEKKRI